MKMMIISHGAWWHAVCEGDALRQKKMKKENHGAWSFLKKRLYHITYIKMHVMLILFIARLNAQVVVF